MANLAAFGLAVTTPPGWEGEIYLPRDLGVPAGPASVSGAAALASATAALASADAAAPVPILHVANFPLPVQRGDYGGGAVELMGPEDLFVSLLEHPPEEAASALFSHDGLVWPLRVDDFSPQVMQRRIPGQAGCQRFFTHRHRPFCLYVAIGSYRNRAALVAQVNVVLATVGFD